VLSPPETFVIPPEVLEFPGFPTKPYFSPL
jgi:hypothetical protein